MTNIAFDTLQFAKRAELAGYTKEQAEFQAEEFAKFIDTKLATKGDLHNLSNEMKKELQLIRKDIDNLSNKLTIRFGSMLVVAISVLAAIIKLL